MMSLTPMLAFSPGDFGAHPATSTPRIQFGQESRRGRVVEVAPRSRRGRPRRHNAVLDQFLGHRSLPGCSTLPARRPGSRRCGVLIADVEADHFASMFTSGPPLLPGFIGRVGLQEVLE